MTGTAREIPRLSALDTANAGANFTAQLDTGEMLTGTPTVVEQTTSDLTIDGEAVNTAAVTINGESVAVGKAVVFSVTGAVAGRLYTLLVTVDTDASPAQTLTLRVRFRGDA